MSDNIIMLLDNVWDDSNLTLIRGDEISSLPLSNTQFHSNYDLFRTTTTDEITIEVEFSHLRNVSGLALNRINFTTLANIRIQGFSSNDTSKPALFDTGFSRAFRAKPLGELQVGIDQFVPAPGGDWRVRFVQRYWEPTLAKKLHITIQDPNNRDGYLEFARGYLSHAYQPKVNMLYGHKKKWSSESKKKRTESGSLYGSPRPQYREISFMLDALDAAEDAEFFEQTRRLSESEDQDFWVSMYPGALGPEEHHNSMSCQFLQYPEHTKITHNMYEIPFSLGES